MLVGAVVASQAQRCGRFIAMPSTADVVIVGGGVVGSSVAVHLRQAGCRGRVVVVERDDTYSRASSSLAMGGIRQQFTLAPNVRMVQYSVDFYRDLDLRLSAPDEAHRVDFRQRGYLFLADADSAARLTRRYEAMRVAGANVRWLSRDGIREKLPDAWLDDVEFGVFGPDDGYANPRSVLLALRTIAEDAGVEYVCGEVSRISRTDDRVTGVVFGGDSIDTPVVVNAAGAFAARIADLAGVSLPVSPVRQHLFRCDLPRRWDYRFPMVVDPSGMHWRHDDTRAAGVPDRIVVAKTNPDETPAEDFTCDDSRWLAEFSPPLVRRMPSFTGLMPVEGWAGLYEMTPDHSPIIGEHPDVGGFFLANGFSGHGLMMAPATGRAVAEIITSGAPRTIDVSVFRFDRFRSGALLPADHTI
jgi:glycine/D-amino acid oxidase-like deaminating enzyme